MSSEWHADLSSPSDYGSYSGIPTTQHDVDLERGQLYLCARPRLRPYNVSEGHLVVDMAPGSVSTNRHNHRASFHNTLAS